MSEDFDTSSTKQNHELSFVLIKLMKGILEREEDETLWYQLLRFKEQVCDYIGMLGLALIIHEEEGLAWLKTETPQEGKSVLPRLINKRQLSYPVSLLLALLRRRLVEHDAKSGTEKLILDKEELIEEMRLFMTLNANEAKLSDQMDVHINKIIELGFLRRLDKDPSKLEVRRIIKAFIDAQWLHDFEKRLNDYALYLKENV